jgi:recombinational DNA repair protein (RecF pathway)
MLSQLESCPKRDISYLYYKLKILEISGYLPMLQGCGICKGDVMDFNFFDHQIDFSPDQGSIICKRCINRIDGSIKVSKGTLIFLKSVLRWNPSSIDRIRIPDFFILETADIINAHVSYLFGHKNK